MRYLVPLTLHALILAGCGGSQPAAEPPTDTSTSGATDSEASPEASQAPAGEETADNAGGASSSADETSGAADSGSGTTASSGTAPDQDQFVLRDSNTAKSAQGATASKIKATKTHAAIKFMVVDKEKGPIPGVVVSLTSPTGTKYFTQETDATGYAEVLVPNSTKYDIVYLSLGRKDITASVPVTNEANQNIRLTLRYKRWEAAAGEERFILDGVNFDTGKATIRPESLPRLDGVLEYLSHKPSARIEISGHTDNVGNPKSNKALSEKRAHACRDYLISKGIEASRIEAVGYGDERPIAPNDDDAGRQRNRRIEAREL